MKMTGGNIADLVRHAGTAFANEPAVYAASRELTWAELDRAVDVGVQALQAAGAQPGEAVIIALPTTPELIVTLLAAARAGLVLVPMAPQAGELAAVASQVNATLAVADPPLTLPRGRIDLASVTAWFDKQTGEYTALGSGEDLAALAGTTRAEGGVMLSHRAILAAVQAITTIPGLRITAADRVLQAMPLAHVAGLVTVLLPAATVGASVVLPDGRDAAAVLACVDTYRVTVIPGMPLLYRALLAEPGMERALASVRLMTSGTAPLPPADLAAFRFRTGQPIYEGYGLSEAASAVTSALMSPGARPGSAGLCLPGMELRIVTDDGAPTDDDGARQPILQQHHLPDVDDDEPDANDADAATAKTDADQVRPRPVFVERLAEAMPPLAEMPGVGEVGRIAIRGPQLFSGYWPGGTDGPDGDGWFITADTGFLDGKGELHLLDRTTDTIIVNGFTVYPWEVETALSSHPYVVEAAVVGWPVGPAMVALIVAQPGTRPTPEDLDEHLAELLPAYKRPGGYQVVAELPRGVMGRVDRGAALATYAASNPQDLRFVPSAARSLAVVDAAAAMAPPPEVADCAGKAEAEQPEVGTAPEQAADLSELGRKLPMSGDLTQRGAQDTDADLF